MDQNRLNHIQYIISVFHIRFILILELGFVLRRAFKHTFWQERQWLRQQQQQQVGEEAAATIPAIVHTG